jgi:phosphoserine phosphatase
MCSESVDRHPRRDAPRIVATDPGQVTTILRRHADAPLFVDLDETLVLRSTTDAFLDAARPSSLVAVALRVVDRIRPWRALPGRAANRDWVRVVVVLLLTPWSLLRWRRSADRWAATHRNEELVRLAEIHGGHVVVVTRGFRPIVEPVVAGLGLRAPDLVACRLFRWRGQRHIAKSTMLEASHPELVDEAVCVTDSLDDADVLERVAVPVLVTWPDAEPIEPQRDAYIPLRYIHETKPPKRAFIRVAWLTDDLYVTVLTYAVVAWWFPFPGGRAGAGVGGPVDPVRGRVPRERPARRGA